MGSYFPPLNLTLDADERAVKRAYAVALKETRPEDDPAAFQALVAARDRALDWVRRRPPVIADGPGLGDFLNIIIADASPPANEAATALAPVRETAPVATRTEPVADPATDISEGHFELNQLPTGAPPRQPIALPATIQVDDPPDAGFAALVRAQQTVRQLLIERAISLIEEQIRGYTEGLPEKWDVLITAADDLDLSGRLSLERAIVIALDKALIQLGADSDHAIAFADTILKLDRTFRWSFEVRRIVRILGEPSGAHPLVFAVERYGESAIRLRMTATGFPLIPDSDLAAWFGTLKHASVRAYRKALITERFAMSWSWYAFFSPPAWLVRTGLSIWGIGFAGLSILPIYLLFDPIANPDNANSFFAFLAVLIAARAAVAASARSLEIGKLVSVLQRIDAGPLPTPANRRRMIMTARGSRPVNFIVSLFFLMLVDGYCLSLIIPAMTLKSSLVSSMIVVPDRKTVGVTFADRLVAQSYIDHAREIAASLDTLLVTEAAGPSNPFRRKRIESLQARFLDTVKTMPVGEFASEFERYRSEINELKRH